MHHWLCVSSPEHCLLSTCLSAGSGTEPPELVGSSCAPFRSRIISLDASLEAELLLCGDQQGNITAFRAPADPSPGAAAHAGAQVPFAVPLVKATPVRGLPIYVHDLY